MNGSITLTTELTEQGIVCTNDVLGKVATIIRNIPSQPGYKPEAKRWYVFPYATPPYEDGRYFDSLRAAEFYALTLAYERAEGV